MSELKKKAAEKAVEFVKSGMVLGLGTGSTTYFALVKIAELLKNGELKNIVGIPSSVQTENQANELGIPLTTLDKNPEIDLTIDGADEIDKNLNLIKGGGGALLREKVLAQASKKEIIIADLGKCSDYLGEKWHVPVEVLKFAVELEKNYIESIGAKVTLRVKEDNSVFITDEGNVILDCDFGIMEQPGEIAVKLERRAGIVEHGMFVDVADVVIVAAEDGIKVEYK